MVSYTQNDESEEILLDVNNLPVLDSEQIGMLRKKILSDEMIDLAKFNIKPVEEMFSRYSCAIMEIETKFKVLNEQLSLEYDGNPIESIKTRLKSLESLTRKVRDKNIPFTIEAIEKNINDIAGIRVICSFPKDIYILEESFLRQDDIKLIKRKDYIKNPKPNGYRSLHLIVEMPIFLKNETRRMKVEVQLRTIAMDFWASLEHKLRYKKKRTPEQETAIANELLACANESAALDLRMQSLRNFLDEDRDDEEDERERFGRRLIESR